MSRMTWLSFCVFVSLSLSVDLMVYGWIPAEHHRLFVGVTVAKYVLPLAAKLIIDAVSRAIDRSLGRQGRRGYQPPET